MPRTQTFANNEQGLNVRTKLNSLSSWNSIYSYGTDDATYFSGSAYFSLIDSNLGNVPTNTSFWKIGGSTLTSGSTYPITSSWAENTINASFVSVTSSVQITSSISSSWSSASLSASYVPNLYPQTIQISASWASASLSASWAPSIPLDVSVSSSWASSSISSSYSLVAQSVLNSITSASYAGTASILLGNVESASYALSASKAESSSYAPVEPTYSASVSSNKQNTLITGDIYTVTSSWSNNSTSASYVPDLYPQTVQVSASWASQSLSASYVPDLYPQTVQVSASWASSSISSSYAPYTTPISVASASWVSASVRITIADTASFVVSSSHAISSSYAVNGGGSGITLTTGSTYPITSSQAVSASYAYSAATASYSNYYDVTIYHESSSFASSSISASHALTSISASLALQSLSSSWVPDLYPQVFQPSSSWASQSLSASYAPVEPSYSASVSTVKQNTLITGGTYTITSSWAENAVNGGTTLVTGSTYQITSSWSNNLQNYPLDVTQSVDIAIASTNHILLQHSTSSIVSAFYNYSVSSGSNARAGTISAIWNGSSILYSDNSTDDIGDTTDIYVFPILSYGVCQLIGYSSSSINWNVNARGTYL